MALPCLFKTLSSVSRLPGLLQLRVLSTTASSYQPFGASDNALVQKCTQQLEEIKQAGTFKVEREITTPQGASVGRLLGGCLIIKHALLPACAAQQHRALRVLHACVLLLSVALRTLYTD